MQKINEIYTDKELGLIYSKEKSIFRVWAPTQKQVKLALYQNYSTLQRQVFEMKKDEDGVFECEIEGDLESMFYTYILNNSEVCDPYSFSTSANSVRSAIVDLKKSNPEGFEDHYIPFNDKDKAIIVETHVADISINENSGAINRGLFLGAAEIGTKCNNVSTNIDHFEELGVTHVHLLPVTDYITVNELKPLSKYPGNYNWGYDQELYMNIEGSFSTNPNDPYSRIREFKTLIKNYHEKGMSIVLDVVYNHTFKTFDSVFNTLVPNYYYRMEGSVFANGSGCGNEIASEKPMVRKFIIDSLLYLAKEYKIDGFRFDLMALTDIDTLMEIIRVLREYNPNILIYGEPWMANPSPLDYNKQVNIGSQKGKDFAIFNPFFRDAFKGDNDGTVGGYLQGEYYNKYQMQVGIAGSVPMDEMDTNFENPLEVINYFNAHDNLIFYDKLVKTGVSEENINDLTYMAFSILMTSQGLPFFHSGNSFLRTKKLNHNSYNASTDINGIDWSLKEKNYDLFLKIKDIIKLRKDLGIFNMKTGDEVREKISFIDNLKDYVLGYIIDDGKNSFLILHNVSKNIEDINMKDLTDKDEIKLIFSNGFVDEDVNNIKLESYTTNVYII
ncbi:type I pullulanase [Helcococcus sueciensis]|uniref:type I pullulanase n=1 Tax=Helcococcus sueciensis TaxID=241555 RepID=UPI0004097ED7|nr:type I pullulanase [Helcococcus sueciensis]